MLRRKLLSLGTALAFITTSGLAVAQDTTIPPPAAPPAAEPAPAEVVIGEPGAAPAGDEERVEEIEVTGTRIRRKDLTTPAPVTVISRDQLQASGKVRIGDFLQALPEQGNAINTQFNNGGDGATRVSLRGLGEERTLVLINGRRVVPGGTGADASVDLNSIPTQAIERVEILKDGASAVYGSDAVAGVINLITRKSFDGASVAAYAGTSQQRDGTLYDVSVTAGTAGERGSLLFSAGYSDQRAIWAGDRDWSATPLYYDFASGETVYGGSVGTPAGTIDLDPATCTNAKCAEVFANNGSPTGLETYVPDPTNPSGYRIFDLPDLYNFQPENYLVTPQERIQLFAIGDTRLGDVARGYFEASYVNRQSAQTLAPEPLFADVDPLFVSSESIYNPFGHDLTWVGRRLVEFGRRTFEQDLDTFRVVGGVDGTLPETLGPFSNWFWDVSLNYGRTQGVSTTQGTLRAPLVQDAIGPSMDPDGSVLGPDGIRGTADDGAPSGDEICVRTPGDATTAIPGCVPLDIVTGAGSITEDMVGGLGFTGTDRGNNQLTSFQVNTSGDLFQLLADRPVGLAVGYEYRDVRGAFIPNPITAAFENTGNNTSPAQGSYYSNEVYGELSIPIVSNLPLAQDLEATLAARWFDYSTFGDDITYKAGLRWRIIPDVTVRGTFSTAFRAPSVADLYSGQFESFEAVSDPCAGASAPASCGAAANNGDNRTQLPTLFGGSTDVEPETADIYTLGLVWEPRWVRNLSVTLDYYNIDVTDAISTLGAGTILQNCYERGIQQYCDLVERSPVTNRIIGITDTTTNVGGTRTAGIDLALRYGLPTGFGRFGFVFDGTWLQKYDEELADGTVIEAKGVYDLEPGESVFPEWKFNTGVTWGLGSLGAGVAVRYIGAFEECAPANGLGGLGGLCYQEEIRAADEGRAPLRRDVDAWASTDLFVSYALQSTVGQTSFQVGINNVLDDNPRIVWNGSPTYAMSDPTAYDYIGRFFWARIEHAY